MVKPELGTKRVCVACSAKFYDLQKAPAICPKCETEQPAEQPRMRRPAGNVAEDKRPKKPAPAAEDTELDPAPGAAEDETDEDVLEDSTDIEDDDDDVDVAEDIGVETVGDEEP